VRDGAMVAGFNYSLEKKKKRKKNYMVYMNIILDLQSGSEEFGVTLKPKGSSLITTNL
jgi:hypothetical protein